ncbi:MAG: immunoglobulin [Clostridia bacterium]|nr:immunoglobulin [Clostridia bacterium]
MKLLPAEKETIINFDESSDSARIYTHDSRLKSKLKMLYQKFPEKIHPDREVTHGAVSFVLPKTCIVIYPPHTDEWKAAARERAKNTGFQPGMKDK